MLKKRFFLLLLLLGFYGFAQTKGIVVDENNKPIPYVSIWVENENIGTTSEENGQFEIHVSDKNKNLIFSSLGFEKKIIRASDAAIVKLVATAYNLKEVVILNKKETREKEIGQTNGGVLQAFDNGPRMDAKFFPYSPSYKKTKFIKQVTIFTDSNIDNATIKIHLYGVDANGFPGDELLGKDFIVTLKKGVLKHKIDITEFNLTMPSTGIFVAYEKLMIENNKREKAVTDEITHETKIQKTYFPFVLYNYTERDFLFTFSGGKWHKQITKENTDSAGKPKVFEPAINLILTN